MEKQAVNNNWSKNVIVVDADYVDNVAFNLIVNFERIIGRRIPQADLARWLDCIALDGGVRNGEMQPLPGGNFRQEILGYSLMNALGIRSDEINAQ